MGTPNKVPIILGNPHVDVAQLLLEAGADKDLHNEYGSTALIHAARNGQLEIARLLVQAGAVKDLRHKYGASPLTHAARNGPFEIAMLLLKAGAEKHLQEECDTTRRLSSARLVVANRRLCVCCWKLVP